MNTFMKSEFTKEETSFLLDYLNTSTPCGHEATGQKKWIEYIRPFVDTIYTDVYGTAVAVINPKAAFKVAIEAHVDEISRLVQYISPEGLLYVIRNG